VTLTSGQAITMKPIQLKASADLYVRVDDPNGTRATTEGNTPGVSLMLAVRSPNGAMIAVPKTASDSAGADHHLPVPVATDLTFVAFSSNLSMTHGVSAAAVDKQAGLSVPINIPVGQQQHKEVVTVH
jgi:hypothetical protein